MVHALRRIPIFNCPSLQDIPAANGSSTLVVGEVSVRWNGNILARDGADWVRGGGLGNGMGGRRNVQLAVNTP